MTNHEIGARVREVIAGRQQQDVAAAISMAPDALSRSLNGKRAFSTLELVQVADLVGADVHWLITGEADPMAMRLAARHTTDPTTFERTVPGQEADTQLLRDIELCYRKVYTEPVDLPDLPTTAADVRAALGDGFVRCLADRVEERLGIDIVRLADISTEYGLVIGGRPVIVVQGGPHWYRENFGIAHEVAHLCLRHLGTETTNAQEAEANSFAAELLLPEEMMREIDWAAATPHDLAAFLWTTGVSTKTLRRRLSKLRLPAKADLDQGTERLLRAGGAELDPGRTIRASIAARAGAASERRFPAHLREAHYDGIVGGSVQPSALAWMLDVPVSTYDDDLPRLEPQDLSDLDDVFSVGA